jgi:hypothetical protein
MSGDVNAEIEALEKKLRELKRQADPWKALHSWQLDFRARNKISAVQFASLLGLPSSTAQYLYRLDCFPSPSVTPGTNGAELRAKLASLKESNRMDFDT